MRPPSTPTKTTPTSRGQLRQGVEEAGGLVAARVQAPGVDEPETVVERRRSAAVSARSKPLGMTLDPGRERREPASQVVGDRLVDRRHARLRGPAPSARGPRWRARAGRSCSAGTGGSATGRDSRQARAGRCGRRCRPPRGACCLADSSRRSPSKPSQRARRTPVSTAGGTQPTYGSGTNSQRLMFWLRLRTFWSAMRLSRAPAASMRRARRARARARVGLQAGGGPASQARRRRRASA